MNQIIYLIQADPINFSIDRIYSILWSIIQKTNQQSFSNNIFICPHTVQIKLNQNQKQDEIYYQPQNCRICSQNEFRTIQQQLKYKYMICGILYFLLEGQENLQQYYETQNFFFFQELYGYYNENQNFLRSICQILTKEDYQQKQLIFANMPESNRPRILLNIQLTKYRVIIISPCLGAPQFRSPQDSSVFYLLSFQRFLFDLRQLQIIIGMNNPLPPPCIHNVFIGQGYQNYCKFRINIYQTNPICKCQNKQMGTILYSLLTGLDNQNHQNCKDNDQIMDEKSIEFSKKLINEFQFNNAQEQFEQYNSIIEEIDEYRRSMSMILENLIDPSFYANSIKNNLIHINQQNLWRYYKILFLQEMIELLENRILANPFNSIFLLSCLFQLKNEQNQRIQAYLQIQNIQLLQNILLDYQGQLENQNIEIQQLNFMNQINNQGNQLLQRRLVLYQQFSQVMEFHDPNNQFFRERFGNDFNYQTIIEFEDLLQNDQLQQ